MPDARESVIKGMKPMIEKARRNGMWLWSRYQDLWFSPDELESKQAAGRFCWGPANWSLRHPSERLKELESRCDRAFRECMEFRDRLLADSKRKEDH